MTQALRELQRDLQRHVLGEPSPIADAIADVPPLPVAERLAIYGSAYRARLIDALRETYPILHAVLGDEDFSALGGQFIAAHRSVYRSIRWYGAELAQFLNRQSPFAGQPLLAELALLEWTLGQVFDAADAESVTRAAIAAVDPAAWSGIRLVFHPSLRRLHLRWNTVPVWRAMSRDEAPPQPLCGEQPLPWLLWRHNLQNYFRSLEPDEAAALDAALRGDDFGELCRVLAEWLPPQAIPMRAAGLLGAWADSGIIVGVMQAP